MNKNHDREIVLEVKNLKQHFVTGTGKYRIYNKAVDGVSFEIYRGEVFSLVGESGCGKTTTGRTIMRLYQPTDGEVYLLNKRIVAGTLSQKNEIKNYRKDLSQKRKEFKENKINKEQFSNFSIEINKKIENSKLEIKQRKLDQFNKYIPSNDEVEADKENANINIKQINSEIVVLQEKLQALKKKNFNNNQNSSNNLSDEQISPTEVDSSKKIKNKIKEINNSILHLKNEITKNQMSYNAASKTLLKKIQMIFQDPIDSLDPRMTVHDIVAEGLYINGITNKDVVREKVYHSLKLVGLMPEHASHYPHEFSGGQRQRVGIARAIACDPEVIIADEPISALDVSIQAQIINLLNDLKTQLGLTILFIAHDLSVVKHFSDKVAVMYFGVIVEIGDKQKVFDNPLHPYTKSLISSIPQPNPQYEKLRGEISRYNPNNHNYTKESVIELREIEPGHKVLCSEEEYSEYIKLVNEK